MSLDPLEDLPSWSQQGTIASGVLLDPQRVAAARHVLALEPDAAGLRELADIAADLLDAGRAEVVLLTDQRVVAATSSTGGLDDEAPWSASDSICGVAVLEPAPTVVPDTSADERLSLIPDVSCGRIGAYLGAPLVVAGQRVGVLCAYDAHPRPWIEAQVATLTRLARRAGAQLERHQASAEVFGTIAGLDLALGAAGIGCFEYVPATGALRWDRRLIDLFGYQPGTFVPHFDSFMQRVHPEDRFRVEAAIDEALAAGGEFAVEYRIVLPEGAIRWMSARGRLLLAADDSVRLFGAAVDTSEVLHGRDQVSRVLETMTDGFFSLDADWQFTYLNASAEPLLGRTRQQLIGRGIWDAFPEAVGTDFERRCRRAMATGETVDFPSYFPSPVDKWFQVRAWPVATSLSVYFHDITARRRVEQEREQAFAETELARARLALLAEMTRALVSTLDVNEAMTRLARIVVPRLADWASVTLINEAGNLEQAVGRHADPARTEQIERFPHLYAAVLNENSNARRVARTGQPILRAEVTVDELAAGWRSEELTDLLREIGLASLMIVPLQARDRTLGVLVLAGGPGRPPFTEADLATAAEVGQRAGLAIDNARLYSRQRTAVESLQRHLLPALPAPDHIELVARYRPAAEEAQVGGDFYWGALQEDGATLAAIGDVSGHDLTATSWQAQLAPLLRGFAFEGSKEGPASILGRVDRAMRGLQIDTMASVVLARVEQRPEDGGAQPGDERWLRWSNAGHPPPMLLRADGRVEVLDREPDLLLGLDPATTRADHLERLEPGDTVLLYTDGLIERRDSPLDTGLARLRQTLSALAGVPLEQMCDELLTRMLASTDPEDDIAMLAIRAHPEDRPRPAEAGPTNVPLPLD